MPSKYGFGNTRKKSPYKKANYGGDQKNPVKKINLKEIQYEKIALYYFDLLVQRQCGLNDLFRTVDNAKKKKTSK